MTRRRGLHSGGRGYPVLVVLLWLAIAAWALFDLSDVGGIALAPPEDRQHR